MNKHESFYGPLLLFIKERRNWYGNCFQFVLPTAWGHVSVCIEKEADPIDIGLRVKMLVENE